MSFRTLVTLLCGSSIAAVHNSSETACSAEGISLLATRTTRRQVVNADRATTDPGLPLIPYPAFLEHNASSDSFPFGHGVELLVGEGISDDDFAVQTLRNLLAQHSKGSASGAASISLRTEGCTLTPAEGYGLHISKNEVRLEASDLAGLFYGVQTMRQLIAVDPQGLASLPAVNIRDAPRFGWRGLHLDVSRHFFGALEVKRLIDTMAGLKLNRFHWHLTDDQGWRLPIRGLPKLTQIGAEGFGGRQAYTEAEVEDLVAFAAKRHIQVIPEIDVPGHAASAIAAYPELGNDDAPGWSPPQRPYHAWGVTDYTLAPREKTWEFLSKVYDTVARLFPSPWVHIGGDEAKTVEWSQSPQAISLIRGGFSRTGRVQSIFNQKTAEMLRQRGRKAVGWDEVQQIGGLPDDSIIMGWRSGDEVVRAARAGRHVVNANQDVLYFDHYQGASYSEPKAFCCMSTLEQVYHYDPMPAGLTQEQQKLVLGAQGQLWSEYLPDWQQVEYMAHPRSMALAERVWTPNDSIRGFDDFKRRAEVRVRDLDLVQANYRRL